MKILHLLFSFIRMAFSFKSLRKSTQCNSSFHFFVLIHLFNRKVFTPLSISLIGFYRTIVEIILRHVLYKHLIPIKMKCIINVLPTTISTNIDVVCIKSSTKLFCHNLLLKQVHFFFILKLKENCLYELVKAILLLCSLKIFATSKIVIIYILCDMLSNIDFVIDYVCDLIDQIMLLNHCFTFIFPSLPRLLYLP